MLLGLGLIRLAAAGRQQQGGNGQQIKIENPRVKIHSGRHKNVTDQQSKDDMGQQYNKTEHKKRRKAYIKRKKAVIKAKVATKKKG
jgi:hypothetical protein